ncbi:cell wall hydrolase [Ruminococcus sp. CLA-AA-H200]|uniref:Cell wall hydrolase n=1 Tax=Ruminococcus turbiniformis TaxID=2881258 RepID=A0ABS8G501_9FIRM|nr:cell wall hydrolase [Ruminococcus turbiniformis]MCC2256004.1 cell wall hydrolase [Ruminococcus turbiniformis]
MRIYKNRWIQTCTALICSLAIVLSVFPSFADDNIDSLEGQSSALQSELEGINQEILTLTNEISTAQMQIEILDAEIARTSDALAEAEANESKQYEDMKSRIKYMYEHGNATLLEMLFSAENMTDFLNKADFIENLSEYDRNALDNLKAVHQQIEDEQSTLQTQQESLASLKAELESSQAELQAKAAETSTDLADVQARLEQARADEAARLAAEAERAAQEAAAEAGNGSTNTDSSYDDSVIQGGGIDASTDDVTLLAAIIQCEAIQDYDALLAVATVIMNRVASPLFPNSISGVVYANGQFEPVWTGRLDSVLSAGPTSLSLQVAQDAINGARLAAVADCYYFLYAGGSNRDGVIIGGNVFFPSW